MRVLIAIDPGASGAIAVRDENGRVYADTMPDTLRDIWEHLGEQIPTKEVVDGRLIYEGRAHDPLCIIEDVGYHVQGNNASASCKFARHVGHLEMALTGLCIPWQSVRPQKWMQRFGTLPKDKKARKNRIKEIVQRYFPSLKVTLTNADALGMMIFAIETQPKED